MSVSTQSAEPSNGDPTTDDHPRAPSGRLSASPPAYSMAPPGTVVISRLPSKSPMYAVWNGTGVRSPSPSPATFSSPSPRCAMGGPSRFACAGRCARPTRLAWVSALATSHVARTSIAQMSELARLIARGARETPQPSPPRALLCVTVGVGPAASTIYSKRM